MAISLLEVVAALSWLAAVILVGCALFRHRLTSTEALLTAVLVTLVPLVGPTAAFLLVVARGRRDDAKNPAGS